MISVLLLGFDRGGRASAASDAVRTLASLVPATVDGVVRDLCLAAPPSEALTKVADHAGCAVVAAASFREAVRDGVARLRGASVLALTCGAVVERPVIDELSTLLPSLDGASGVYRIRAAPDDLLGRLLPATAPTAAVLAPRPWFAAADAASFAALARRARHGRPFRARIWLGR